ncbi:MAG: hypothetical protein AAF988_06660 [Pseudomonadota bacterium]
MSEAPKMSDAYENTARSLVKAADGPLRHTWMEHAAGAWATLFQIGARNLRTCGM